MIYREDCLASCVPICSWCRSAGKVFRRLRVFHDPGCPALLVDGLPCTCHRSPGTRVQGVSGILKGGMDTLESDRAQAGRFLFAISHSRQMIRSRCARVVGRHVAAGMADRRPAAPQPESWSGACLRRSALVVLILASSLTFLSGFADAGGKPSVEQGEFSILLDGREIGSERYMIQSGANSFVSTSVLDFRNPSESRQKVHLETRLEMDGNYVPRAYLLKSDVDGNKGTMAGSFAPNQAMFQYTSGGKPQKRGLLVGNRYTILDSNIYHHFVFLTRLFRHSGGEKTQKFEVVIPQEMESGDLKVIQLRRDDLEVHGKKREVRVLQLDSGALEIQLWVDREGLLQKISVPARALEVVRR